MQFLTEYGLFLLKALTIVAAILIVIAGIIAIASKKEKHKGKLEIKKLNAKYESMQETLNEASLDKAALKAIKKDKKARAKAEKKAAKQKDSQTSKSADISAASDKKRIFILDFDGDIRATAVSALREEITAVLTVATPQDEVLIKVESGGGLVHAYGLAASQLQRIRAKNIPLTIAVDKVAASGGYMMACVANRILAAPFAIIGSVGVAAPVANFHRLLKKHHVDFEQLTAGEYKRTMTMFGENTSKARQKFQADLDDTHVLFKDFINSNRPIVDVDKISTGEHWYGVNAFDLRLVDELKTSDDFLLAASNDTDLYEVKYTIKQPLTSKLSQAVQLGFEKLFGTVGAI